MSHDIHRPENPGPDGECPDCGAPTSALGFLGFMPHEGEWHGNYECKCGTVFSLPEEAP